MSAGMQRYSDYVSEANSLQVGSSILSETASTYVLLPVQENGEPNVSPLLDYTDELSVPRRGGRIAEQFARYSVGSAVQDAIRTAARNAERMTEYQRHAIALMRAAYPLPHYSELDAIPGHPLSASETTLTAEQSREAAIRLLFGETYSRCKRQVSQSITTAISALRTESAENAAAQMRVIVIMRTLLWVMTAAIMLILSLTFLVLFRNLVFPLLGFVRTISSDDSLREDSGLYEVRLLATAYNGLLRRRESLESSLRNAAETDALTGLPNRYHFDKALKQCAEAGHALAVFSFDLNELKQTNDTQGHLAGDDLLRRAAMCIIACFGTEDGKNCFRFGGDEFAAIVRDCAPETIGQMLNAFAREQEKLGVSIATGYAYTPDGGTASGTELFLEADRRMYEKKAVMHSELVPEPPAVP